MSQARAKELIETRFLAQWNQGTLPTAFENTADKHRENAWGRLIVYLDDAFPASIGRAHIRQTGLVVLQIFTPEGKGTGLATRCADALGAIFNFWRVNDGGMHICFQVSGGAMDAGKVDPWLIRNVMVPFRVDTFS